MGRLLGNILFLNLFFRLLNFYFEPYGFLFFQEEIRGCTSLLLRMPRPLMFKLNRDLEFANFLLYPLLIH